MKLYHTTPTKNLTQILAEGIKLHRGVIWLHNSAARRWAIKHLAEHHGVQRKDMQTLAVTVDANDVQSAGGLIPGRFLYFEPIPPHDIDYIVGS